MDKIEKLRRYRDEVHNYKIFDKNFTYLISIKLYDFIHEDEFLKTEFNRRLNYLPNLAHEKSFIELQDNLFNTVQKILKLMTIKDVEEAQQQWNNKVANYFRTKKGEGIKEDIWLTLPEIYHLAKNKVNYYRLGDNGMPGRFNEEVSRNICVMAIKDQYTVNIQRLFNQVFYKKTGDNLINKKLRMLYYEYNKYFYELDELMYCIPIKLNVSRFEKFILDCAKFHQKSGYEFFYSPSLINLDEQKFQKVKINAMSVIDDLIEFLCTNSSNKDKTLNGIRETIHLKKLGVIIDGRHISKGQQKINLNPTDEKIIYFLYLKHKENALEYFDIDVLIKAVSSSRGTILNSISKINRKIKELVFKGVTKIGNFIENEPGRGYHLNKKHL